MSSSETASGGRGVSKTVSADRSRPLSLNVPKWSQEDVCRWIVRAEFGKYVKRFEDKRVDGDLLLQMTEDQLREEIGFKSEIERKRFMRELDKLKQSADYSDEDPTDLKSVLQSVGPELTVYTYPMLKAGVDSDSIWSMSDDQLADECGITNSIHRTRILNSSVNITVSPPPDAVDSRKQSLSDVNKVLDVFISYERCSRSAKLASLLKAHLEFKKYTVRVGSDRPTSGDDALFNIKQAKNFLLVLTDESLHGCIGDDECNNWMHKEIVCAIQHHCNIIPVTENFTWPSAEMLPADMRDVPGFNGVRWVHDYKYACVDKIEKFMLGSVRYAVPEQLRSAPNTPLLPRSPPPIVQNTNYFHAGERDATNDNNWLTVNHVDGSYTMPKTRDKMSRRRLSMSLSNLLGATSELNLMEQKPSQTNDDMAAGSTSRVRENAKKQEYTETSEKIPLGTPKTLFLEKCLNKCLNKFKSIVQ